MAQLLLSIDPGRAKHGIAVVDFDGGRVLEHSIRESTEIHDYLPALLSRYPEISVIVLGNGTGSKIANDLLQTLHVDIPMVLIDKSGSSERARARYCAEHPPKGWQRLLPAGMRSPTCPYDDYAAIVLAEDYLRGQS